MIAGGRFLLIHTREQEGVVVDDRIGNESRAFVPDLLLGLGSHAEFTGVDLGDCAPEPVIGFAAIECFLHALAQCHIVNERENTECLTDIIQFP